MLGAHTIRTYSSTQSTISLSSGEAEYYGLVKAGAAGLGHQAIMRDVGVELPVRLWTDSSAALGISKRSGLGKLRHLETHTLWLQEKVRTGAVEVRKVAGEVNPADIFTKHLPRREKLHQLVRLFGCEYMDGRAAAAPLLRPHTEVNSITKSSRACGVSGSYSANVDSSHACGASGSSSDTLPILPHLLPVEDMNVAYPVVKAEMVAGQGDQDLILGTSNCAKFCKSFCELWSVVSA